MNRYVVLAGVVSVAWVVSAHGAQHAVEPGRMLFDNHCSRCHGIGGTGGEGPSLNRARLRYAADDEALFGVIRDGIEGTDMPGSRQLSDNEVRRVVQYVRSLGRVEPSPVRGDPERGRALYAEKSCSNCHMVAGEGAILGPDLSDIGLVRGPSYLRQSLLSPDAAVPEGYLLVRVVTARGEVVTGVRLNEDSFSIQLRDDGGRVHSFQKRELRELNKMFGRTPMPIYRSELTDAELDDLVAYLVSLRGEP